MLLIATQHRKMEKKPGCLPSGLKSYSEGFVVSGHGNNLQMKGGAGCSPHYVTYLDADSFALHVADLYQ